MDETKKRLLQAKGVDEVAQILREAGDDEANAEGVWQEVRRLREQEGKSLSLDELEAVAGGEQWNWLDNGCAATVEPESSCLGTDGGCMFVNINYDQNVANVSCPFCGARYTAEYVNVEFRDCGPSFYRCRECRRYFYYSLESGQWVRCYN